MCTFSTALHEYKGVAAININNNNNNKTAIVEPSQNHAWLRNDRSRRLLLPLWLVMLLLQAAAMNRQSRRLLHELDPSHRRIYRERMLFVGAPFASDVVVLRFVLAAVDAVCHSGVCPSCSKRQHAHQRRTTTRNKNALTRERDGQSINELTTGSTTPGGYEISRPNVLVLHR